MKAAVQIRLQEAQHPGSILQMYGEQRQIAILYCKWQHMQRGLSTALCALLSPMFTMPQDDGMHDEAIKLPKPAVLSLALMK